MGRETKILLGLLGLLTGAFMGALSIKLLVPRPPAGAGPDVNTELAAAEPHDLVEPPTLTMPASAFAAAPPLVATPAGEPDAAVDRYAARDNGFAAVESLPPEQDDPPAMHRDPFVAPAAFQPPADSAAAAPAGEAEPGAPITLEPEPAWRGQPALDPEPTAPLASGSYVVRPGDSWWTLAERAYGDGRHYRALFAWNRAVDPRITLAPGTPLQVPPLAELAAAWPHLMPR